MKNGFDRFNSILDIVEEMALGYTETFKTTKGTKSGVLDLGSHWNIQGL